ncbi:para-nitrobenzyl esterase [Caulobacter sp. UNC279MFTsu5.1]|nr:para-nitrobenzyl esterase [Caulobacter sp. UNC279MFTsu5.1]
MPLRTLAMALLFAAIGLSSAAHAASPTVTIDSGALSGAEKDGVMSYLGIPYVAPPIGDLRWRAPQPVKAWRGVRQATEFGPVCRQTADWIKLPQSEDCVTLNVWAPARKAARPYPVLIWIHGGAFANGHGGEWGPDGGKSLVQKGVILVSINYRLGVFGFFAHPELSAEAPDHASGNQGFRDQVAALQWVRRNIAAFGGDSGRVTIAGSSAGGSSVAALTVSPLAKGLFQRGIAESGVVGPLPTKATAETAGTALGQALATPHLSDLRKLGAEDLLKQSWRSAPNLDGVVFTEQPQQSFAAGRQNKTPMLLGWNADEGLDLAPAAFGAKIVAAADYERQLQKLFGPQIPPLILAQYPGKTDAQATESTQRLVTDFIGLRHFGWATMQQKAGGPPAYLYYYVHSPAEPSADQPCYYGCKAGHTSEIRFAYGQLWREARRWNADDLALQEQMLGYWTNFVKTGDPNGPGLPKWPMFDGKPDTAQRLGSPTEIRERGAFPDFRQSLDLAAQ